jgi:hypothetical protein
MIPTYFLGCFNCFGITNVVRKAVIVIRVRESLIITFSITWLVIALNRIW